MFRPVIAILCLAFHLSSTHAQTDSASVFSEQRPLVFECSKSLWPYTFMNDEGEPEGYCIDLVKIIMRELDIPYVIRLKSHQETLNDLKAGRADLVLGLNDIYDVKYGFFGQGCVTLLTQSVATPKGMKPAVKTFHDLKSQQVIVNDSSLCHHLMIDYGWGDHAIAVSDLSEAVRKVNDTGEGQVVGNTLSLKWLIEHYQLDDLTLTPVNMPYGEVKFLSDDARLLNQIDKTYFRLCANNRLEPLEEKWFYPDQKDAEHHTWLWFLAGGALLLLAVTLVYFVRELLQNRRSTTTYHLLAHQLARLTQYNKVRFWAYDINEKKFEWHDENGVAIRTYTSEEFAKRYSKEEFSLLQDAIDRISLQHKDTKGNEEIEETLELTARDAEFGDNEQHGFVVHLSVLSRDAHGKPQVIIGTKKDVTKERQLKLQNTKRSLRYLSMFYNNASGIVSFDKDGRMQDANPRSSELLQFDIDEAVQRHVHLNSLLHTSFSQLSEADGQDGQLTIGCAIVNYHIKVVRNDNSHIIGLFVFCV